MFHLADGAVNFGVTLVGGTHVTVKTFEPVAVAMEAIEKERVSCGLLVPTMINMLINHPDVQKYNLTSMRRVFYGASPIAPDLLQAIDIFGCGFIQPYGMTEARPTLTVLLPEDHKKPELLSAAGRQAIGVEVRVVDDEGNDVPSGDIGEVIAKGSNIMMGYWGKPLETEAALRDGWYWTKDMARIDEKWGEAVKAVIVLKPGAEVGEKELKDLENILLQFGQF
jgi:long-chain acyl-CoA synthetase